MKLEFVAFYPRTAKNTWHPKFIGTVHFFISDYGMDIRGVLVSNRNGSIDFQFPHYRDSKKDLTAVSYPLWRFRDGQKQKELVDFLHDVVKPEIRTLLNIYKTKPAEKQNE